MPPAHRRDAAWPILVFAGALAFFLAHLQHRLYGDDVWFVRCIVQSQPFTPHFLYMPVARALADLGARLGLDPFQSLRILSALSAACGAALLSAAALRRGAGAARALLFALLPVCSASALFFATTAEVHAFHLAGLGLLCWCLARLGPDVSSWRVFVLGLACGVFVGTHQSGVLMLPGVVALALWATSGRSPRARGRDALAFAAAGVLSIGVMMLCNWRESGHALAASDTASLLKVGLADRAAYLGWRDLVGYLSSDGVLPAFALCLTGAAGLGLLCRRRPRLALAIGVALLPYALFFPLFHFAERGAYFIVCLPLLAGALLAATSGDERAPWPWLAPVFLLACAGAPLRVDELGLRLGELWPAGLCAAAFLLGLVLPGAPRAEAGAPGRALVLSALGLLLALELVGSLRTLRDYDRSTPLQDWTRAACETTAGRETYLITCGFQEYWLLVLLSAPWREPLAGTWDFAEALPHPTPHPFLYGDPTVPDFEGELARQIAAGAEVLLDQRVADFIEARPPEVRGPLAADLEHIRSVYRLQPLENGPFHAARILPK